MVLIISDEGDLSTTVVVDWLRKLGIEYIRLNDMSFEAHGVDFVYALNKVSIKVGVKLGNKENIDKVWYRRLRISNYLQISGDDDESRHLRFSIIDYSKLERKSLLTALLNVIPIDKWLNNPSTSNINKLYQLEIAQKSGMQTPDSIVTNSKKELLAFKSHHHRIIAKPINNLRNFTVKGVSYLSFTSLVNKDFYNSLDNLFFPMLFQEYIKKSIEVRSFYLDGKFFSMAIFSQQNKNSRIDFRNEDSENPNRSVPYKLPNKVKSRLKKIMNDLKLNSGSIDLIVTPENEYYFLEVNPVGQFGFVSMRCNYYLEKEIAIFLSK